MPSDDFPPGIPTRAPKVREPVFDAPFVVVALVTILLAIQAAMSLASDEAANALILAFGFIPARLTLSFLPAAQDAASLGENLLLGRPWTLLTYALLHGSWTHVALNSIWIVAFGPPVARRIGGARFLALFAATAIAGALVHWGFASLDFTPLIGASAADSGLMAAATRFVFEPGGPLGGPSGYSRSSPSANFNAPAPTLPRLLRQRRVVIFLVIWFTTNFVFGAGAQRLGLSEAPVAWLAHVGGFALGLFLFPLFDRRSPT